METVLNYTKTVARVPLFVISATLAATSLVFGALALITCGDCQGASELLSIKTKLNTH